MEKKRFLKLFLGSFLIIVLLQVIQGCANRDATPKVNFTLDLTQQQYSSLNNIGGYVLVNNVLVAYTGRVTSSSPSGYIAVTGFCTYDNCQLQYRAATNDLFCPCCQSEFYATGAVEFGPASIALYQFATAINGNLLQVYTP